jgi:hypothetical protein
MRGHLRAKRSWNAIPLSTECVIERTVRVRRIISYNEIQT